LVVQVSLKNPLKPKDQVTVKATLVFGHSLEPFPHAIAQSERQLVRYRDNHFAFTPYQTKSSTTTVKLASASVQSSSQLEPTNVKGDSIVYGPYNDLKPLSISPLLVHFESNKAFLTVEYLNREIEISMWGNVAVEEFHRWRNDGAELKGGFSRYEFQVNPAASGHAAVKEVSMNIPAIAEDVYYRDAIGNISTSHHWKNKLLIIPRFPMFGGWQTKFCVGYNVPAHHFLSSSTSVSGQHTLNITFGPSFDDDVFVDHQKVKIILPEGVTDIKVSYPFAGVKQSVERLVTYLDVTGRHVVVLEKNNLVNEMNRQFFQVTFSFSSTSIYREPLLLAGGFFVVFLALIFVSRFNYSIAPEDPKAREELVNKLRGYVKKYKEILSDREDVHSRLDAIAAEGRANAYSTEKPKVLSTLQQKSRDVSNVIDSVERVSLDVANIIQSIEEMEEALTTAQLALHKAKLENVGKTATAAGYQVHERDYNEAKKSIKDLVADLEADL
jgi:oligosaccharyltransferase complex subunit alpha (ribophorin I)